MNRIIGRRAYLVKHQDSGIPQKRSGKADELSLSRREIASTLRNLSIQTTELVLDKVFEVALLQRVPDVGIAVVTDRVDIATDRPLEELRVLRNDANGVSQILQSDSRNVNPIDEDLAPGWLNNAEQRQGNRGFSCTGSSAYLFTVIVILDQRRVKAFVIELLTPIVSPPLIWRFTSRRDGFSSGRYLAV